LNGSMIRNLTNSNGSMTSDWNSNANYWTPNCLNLNDCCSNGCLNFGSKNCDWKILNLKNLNASYLSAMMNCDSNCYETTILSCCWNCETNCYASLNYGWNLNENSIPMNCYCYVTNSNENLSCGCCSNASWTRNCWSSNGCSNCGSTKPSYDSMSYDCCCYASLSYVNLSCGSKKPNYSMSCENWNCDSNCCDCCLNGWTIPSCCWSCGSMSYANLMPPRPMNCCCCEKMTPNCLSLSDCYSNGSMSCENCLNGWNLPSWNSNYGCCLSDWMNCYLNCCYENCWNLNWTMNCCDWSYMSNCR